VLDQFARQNRWWLDPTEIKRDRHLWRLHEAPLRWEPPLPFRFDRDSIYTLRGPRQVGKSTVLKRQIAALLREHWSPDQILYLDVELAGLETASDLVGALRAYVDSRYTIRDADGGGGNARLVACLDEVTRVRNWAGALRGLVDNDELRNVTVIATGSHTSDLRHGGERLPGRRGGGSELDLELLPLSFRDYVTLLDPTLPLPPTVRAMTPTELRESRRTRALIRPKLTTLLDQYLLTGGFLTALNDVARDKRIRAETYDSYRESIVGEFTRADLRESYLREVIDWASDHLGQEFEYSGISASTEIGSKDTARRYLDLMEESYVMILMHQTRSLTAPGPAFRSPKKLHPIDPLFWHLVHAWAVTDPDPWPAATDTMTRSAEVGHLVESVFATHLTRAFGDRILYWRTSGGREIDFVIPPTGPGAAERAPAFVELKYQRQVSDRDAKTLSDAGGGVLVTRALDADFAEGTVYALPAADALVLLDAPSLTPSRH
jgi:predicted AAA+ superfamily ATPase